MPFEYPSKHFSLHPGDIVRPQGDKVIILTAGGLASTTLKTPTEQWFGINENGQVVEVRLKSGKFRRIQCKSRKSNVQQLTTRTTL